MYASTQATSSLCAPRSDVYVAVKHALQTAARRASRTLPPRSHCAAAAPNSPKPKLKAPVPSRAEAPTMGLMSDKDWIASNAIAAIASRPPAAARGGGASGKVPDINYTQRPGFGKVCSQLRPLHASMHALLSSSVTHTHSRL